ncbi:MAG: carboxymuconolactone decarboxylase family protein [Nitrospinaceae bacterium]|nr:carboxymuconolactone decarboxylase family protein [Nitrospinaceae bacterium]NIR55741.1 carboxymuconolactone decarboxylase family protein [Nitrospinaceae bacterium]NIS86181.1 carboxymuconolactone decarboxylase family protein [Nitrospinaceae bacterium]NIT83020.1 carboxymuconolactone decarboxylase family protein [Nitrospinaceae bacterium]NIU45232.1 carboxymuconolactone decarboxylase family protein [Nitrospinaceae bacterium]
MNKKSTEHEAGPILAEIEKKFGFLPNLAREMAASPQVLQLYFKGNQFLENTVLTPKEKQMVMLHVSVFNECVYCQAAHTKGAQSLGVQIQEIETLKKDREISTKRGKALCLATRLLLTKKGWLSENNLEEPESRGVDRRQLFEIIGIIGLKTISNYINHIAGTEIDAVFQ